MTAHEISQIRKELLGLKKVSPLVRVCDDERIASRKTVFDAITAESFNPENALHRLVIRRAVRFLQSFGSLEGWDVDRLLPEALPAMAEAA